MMKNKYDKAGKKKNSPSVASDSPSMLGKHIGKSLLISVCVGFFLTLVGSLLAYFYVDPDRLIPAISLCSSAICALVGGFCAVRIHGHSALLCGTLNGLAMIALMMPISLFFGPYASGYSAAISALLHACYPLLSIVGAYLGLKHPKQKRKKRRI